MLNSCESSLLKPACNLYNPLSMMFLFFVVLFAKVAGSGQNRPNAGKSWDSCSGFYTTGSYKPPVNGITSFEMKTFSVRERIEIKLLGRQRLFKRNSYQIRRNEYSKDNVRLRASHGWLFPSKRGPLSTNCDEAITENAWQLYLLIYSQCCCHHKIKVVEQWILEHAN